MLKSKRSIRIAICGFNERKWSKKKKWVQTNSERIVHNPIASTASQPFDCTFFGAKLHFTFTVARCLLSFRWHTNLMRAKFYSLVFFSFCFYSWLDWIRRLRLQVHGRRGKREMLMKSGLRGKDTNGLIELVLSIVRRAQSQNRNRRTIKVKKIE